MCAALGKQTAHDAHFNILKAKHRDVMAYFVRFELKYEGGRH